ncbi:MAG: YunC family protein [Candidatus Omnitrophica bacterium]|nr:YunC family protein [Candidatus Omnitrophota bacterium]
MNCYMEVTNKIFYTKNGFIEGIHLKWQGFSILLACGSKGFLACGVFDLTALEAFGQAAALVESSPENPIGNLERFVGRNITKANSKAKALGIKEGMSVKEAFELIA